MYSKIYTRYSFKKYLALFFPRHNDHIGTPQELTDAQGNIVWQAEYLAYGKIRKLEENKIENNIRFRYYNPHAGEQTPKIVKNCSYYPY